jgi:uncharacterized protein (DUF2147 family)
MNDPRIWLAGLLAAGVAVVLAPSDPAQAAGDPAFGDWLTVNGAAKVRVAPCATNPALTCGTLFWLKPGAPTHDANNPDAALKSRPLVGVQLVSDLKRDGPGVWKDGKIYVPETGRTARANLSANPDGTLKVEGCVAVICQGKTWTRAR